MASSPAGRKFSRRQSSATIQKMQWMSRKDEEGGNPITQMMEAAAKGDVFELSRILDENKASGLTIHASDPMARTPLHAAACDGMIECVRYLIKQGVDVNAKDAWESTALDDAIKFGHKGVEDLLIENGARLGNLKVSAKRLIAAVQAEDIGAVNSMLAGGTPCDSVDADARTPLHHAVALGNEKIIDILIKANAKLTAVDNFGLTPLGEAGRHSSRTGENKIRDKLVAAGALEQDESSATETRKFVWLFGAAQVFFITMFATVTTYPRPHSDSTPEGRVSHSYGMITDIHVMIFIGFGFLMTFLRKYGHSSVGLNFLVASFVIQWYLICAGFFHEAFSGRPWHQVEINVESLMLADFATAAVLITFGALLGKVTPTQLLTLAFFEVIIFCVLEQILGQIGVMDVGTSIGVHMFGAYFGLAASWVLSGDTAFDNADNASVYHSDIFAMIGTTFLWVYWPSFVAGPATGVSQERTIIATTLSLAASVVCAFISSLYFRGGKFSMVDVQNATLAGGVAIGCIANIHVLSPAEAVVLGCLAGGLSVFGYTKVQPKLEVWLHLHDTCGVNNLHGMPSILATIASAVVCAYTAEGDFANSPGGVDDFHNVYSPRFSTIGNATIEVRSGGAQAGYQLLCGVISLAMALVGGVLSGYIVKFLGSADQQSNVFLDRSHFEVPQLEMPFYFDTRGEINREIMVEEVTQSVHGSNLYRPGRSSPTHDGGAGLNLRDVEVGGSLSAMDTPDPYARRGVGFKAAAAGSQNATGPLISNELLSMKLDLILQQMGSNALPANSPGVRPLPAGRSQGASLDQVPGVTDVQISVKNGEN